MMPLVVLPGLLVQMRVRRGAGAQSILVRIKELSKGGQDPALLVQLKMDLTLAVCLSLCSVSQSLSLSLMELTLILIFPQDYEQSISIN